MRGAPCSLRGVPAGARPGDRWVRGTRTQESQEGRAGPGRRRRERTDREGPGLQVLPTLALSPTSIKSLKRKIDS